MKKMIRIKSIILLLISLILVTGSVFAQEYRNGMKQGVVRVKVVPALVEALNVRTTSNQGLTTGIQALDNVGSAFSAVEMKRVFPYSSKFEEKHRKHGLHLWYEISYSKATDASEVAVSYANLSEISIAEPVLERKLIQPGEVVSGPVSAVKSTGEEPFNDPFLKKQWHYNNSGQTGGTPGCDINLYEAWKITTGSSNVIVSVHDEGVDVKHEDLQDAMWINEAELNGEEGVDDDGNGYRDDIHGFNFSSNRGQVDALSHGTHVAGTIGAVNNNGIGVGGVAGGSGNGDGVRIMSCQILGGRGSGSIADSYVYAADMGSVISQNSWGYTVPDAYEQAVLDAIDYFIAEAGDYEGSPMKGGIVIFAAGNDNIDARHYPGAYESCLSVSALNAKFNKAGYSNFAEWIDIAAPGGDQSNDGDFGVAGTGYSNGVFSTLNGNGYAFMNGTSMACPHVSGVAALVVSKHGGGDFKNTNLWTHLITGVRNIDTIPENAKYVGRLGVGAIDAVLALASDNGIAPNKIINLNVLGIAQDFVTLEWTVPADEDDGRALAFEIIASTDSITMANLKFAKVVKIDNKMGVGETQTYEFQGLNPLTQYYFAVRGIDRWGNTSVFSNQLKATTNDGPDASVDKSYVRININVAENVEGSTSFNLLNSGKGLLKWNSVSRHAKIKPFSNEGINYPTLKVNPAASQGQVKAKMTSGSVPTTYEDGKQYFGKIRSYMNVGELDLDLTNSCATRFYVEEEDGFNLTAIDYPVFHNEETGPVVLEIYEGENISNALLLYAQEINSTNEAPHVTSTRLKEQIFFEQGKTFWVVYHVPAGNEFPLTAGIEAEENYSDNCFFSSSLGQSWQKLGDVYDDQVVWLVIAKSENDHLGEYVTLSPGDGQVASEGSQEITASVDASKLVNGSYTNNVVIYTNETDESILRVPVYLKVEGHKPDLRAPQLSEFGSVILGREKEIQVTVANAGYGMFYNPQISISDPQFELVSNFPTLPARMQIALAFRYKPTKAGNANAVVSLTDSNGEQFSFNLFAVGGEPPVIEITPANLSYTDLTIGDTVQGSFTIKNAGKYPLEYFLPSFSDGSNFSELDDKLCKFGYTSNIRDGEMTPEEWNDISQNADGEVSSTFKKFRHYYHQVDLGFEFPFFGKMETQVNIVKFGLLSFDQNSVFNKMPMWYMDDNSPDRLISAFGQVNWSMAFDGKVYYKRYSDKFIVQYDKLKFLIEGLYPSYFTYQIVLHDNGNINFYYKDMDYNTELDFYKYTAYVGIEDNIRGDGAFIRDNTDQRYDVSSNSVIEFINPGLGLVSTVDKPQGFLQVGESTEVNFTLETTDLYVAEYVERLSVVSNDPLHNPAFVTMNVGVAEGGAPELKLSHTELNFGQVFQKGEKVQGFHLSNSGKATVNVEDISFANGYYTVSGEFPVTLKPGRDLTYQVKINSSELGQYEDTLTITLSSGESHTIALTGEVIEAPEISWNLCEIDETLNFGSSKNLQMTVENNGANPLEFASVGTEWLTLMEKASTNSATVPDKTYTWKTSNDEGGPVYQYEDIIESGTKLEGIDPIDMKNYWKEVVLPFSFEFYGNQYDTLYVGYSGLVTFTKGQEGEFHWGGWYIPEEDGPNNFIAPCWAFCGYSDYRIFPETGIYYQEEDDRVIITYKDWYNWFDMGSAVTWQVLLYANGNIKFQYDLGTNDYTTPTGVVGIENVDGTEGIEIMSRSKWLEDDMAILFTPAEKYTIPAGSNKTYDVLVDATDLFGGTYTGELELITNDPVNEEVRIPASLTVQGSPVVDSPNAIDFGQVMAISTPSDNWWDDQYQAYEQEFEIKNGGSADLVISRFAFSEAIEIKGEVFFASVGWDGMLMPPMWSAFDMIWGDVIVAPQTSIKVKTMIVPSGNFSEVKDTLRLTCNLPEGQLDIPVLASVIMPPALSLPTDDIRVIANTDEHNETRTVVLDNSEGKSDLEYSLSLNYKRKNDEAAQAVTANSTYSTAEAPQLEEAQVVSVPSTKSAKATEEFNRVLQHDDKEVPDSRIGYGGSMSFHTATAFQAPNDGFNLTHVMTWYCPEENLNSTIHVKILGGSTNINEAVVLYSMDYEYNIDERDDTGKQLTIELDTNLVFYPNEVFYVAFNYPTVVKYAQGTVDLEESVANRYYFGSGQMWYETSENGYDFGWFMRAAELEAASGAWVVLESETEGTIPAGEQKEVTLAFNAAPAQKGDNEAELVVVSNDPYKLENNVDISLYKNQNPEFKEGELNLSVNENDTLTLIVKAIDPDADVITYSLEETYEYLSTETTEDGLVIVYNPGYESAGVEVFTIVARDQFGNEAILLLNVDVINVNRAPELMDSIEDREYYEDEEFDYIDLLPIFSDPDNEVLSYNVTVDNPVVTIFTSEEEMAIRPLVPGEATLTVVASDAEGLSAETSFRVTIGTVTGIEDPEGTLETKVYPVPTSGPLNIVLGNDIEGEVSISILNVTGLTQYQTTVNKMSGEHIERLNISNMPSGIYLVKISSAKGDVVKRVVKI